MYGRFDPDDVMLALSNGMSHTLYYLYHLMLSGGRITRYYETADHGYSIDIAYADYHPSTEGCPHNVGGLVLETNENFNKANKKLWP